MMTNNKCKKLEFHSDNIIAKKHKCDFNNSAIEVIYLASVGAKSHKKLWLNQTVLPGFREVQEGA